MNDYSFEECVIGKTEEFAVTVTEEMMDKFLSITGDINPLHNEEEYALSKGMKGRVCYGMLTASFMSTLAGVYLPGKKSLIMEISTKFSKPVFIGDVITIKGEVIDRNDTFNDIELKVTMINQDNVKVLKGKMKILIK